MFETTTELGTGEGAVSKGGAFGTYGPFDEDQVK
jgi:hypothetical protein